MPIKGKVDYKTDKWRKYYREYRKKNRERRRAIERKVSKKRYLKLKKSRKFDTPKVRARASLSQAVYHGKIIKPNKCERCKVEFEKRFIHGHHPDYTKPYAVIWLCSPCHGFIHRKFK